MSGAGTQRTSAGRGSVSVEASGRCVRGPETSPATSTLRSSRTTRCSARQEADWIGTCRDLLSNHRCCGNSLMEGHHLGWKGSTL